MIKEVLADSTLRKGGELNFMDKVFENETNRLVKATEICFETMQFREGIQRGWFEMMIARNEYRSWCQDSGVAMHEAFVRKWAESLIIIMCPICPHWCELFTVFVIVRGSSFSLFFLKLSMSPLEGLNAYGGI